MKFKSSALLSCFANDLRETLGGDFLRIRLYRDHRFGMRLLGKHIRITTGVCFGIAYFSRSAKVLVGGEPGTAESVRKPWHSG